MCNNWFPMKNLKRNKNYIKILFLVNITLQFPKKHSDPHKNFEI